MIQVEVKSAVEGAHQEEMKSVSRNVVEETMCDVLATGYSAATEKMKDSFLFDCRKRDHGDNPSRSTRHDAQSEFQSLVLIQHVYASTSREDS